MPDAVNVVPTVPDDGLSDKVGAAVVGVVVLTCAALGAPMITITIAAAAVATRIRTRADITLLVYS